jgi:hypothetical protein
MATAAELDFSPDDYARGYWDEFEVLSGYSDLVTAYLAALISWPPFLAHRQRVLFAAKLMLQRFEEEHPATSLDVYLRTRGTATRAFYWGAGVTAGWTPPDGRRWFVLPPGAGSSAFPLALDALRAVRAAGPSRDIDLAMRAIAPRWRDFAAFGMAGAAASKPRWDDIHGGRRDYLFEKFFSDAAAVIVASLGAAHGLIIPHAGTLSPFARRFLKRLVRESAYTGFGVAFGANRDAVDALQVPGLLEAGHAVAVSSRSAPSRRLDPALTRLLAVCERAVPLGVLARAGIAARRVPAEMVVPVSGVGDCAWLDPERRETALAPLDGDARRARHAAIFAAWDPDGFGYLERAAHAIASDAPDLLRAQHTTLVHGAAIAARDLLYDHFRALAAHASQLPPDEACAIHVGAGRLAMMVGDGASRADSIGFFTRSLATASPPLYAQSVYSIANLYAQSRAADSLALAEEWYRRGDAAVAAIPAHQDAVYARVKLLNGRALVRYLQHDSAAALALEQDALQLARSLERENPALTRWANTLVRANLAQLWERRFHNEQVACATLEENYTSDCITAREHARVELSRMRFDRQDYDGVIALLSPRYGDPSSRSFDEPRELLARMLLTVALLVRARDAEAGRQFPRILYLTHSLDAPKPHDFFDLLLERTAT